MKIEKEFLNGFWAETELDPRAQCALGLLRPGHSAETLGSARAPLPAWTSGLLTRPMSQQGRPDAAPAWRSIAHRAHDDDGTRT
jgi:hypothetical protein